MLTDAELDALARDILTHVIARIKSEGHPQIAGFDETRASGPIVTYRTNTQGAGDVLCEYAPLDTVKTIIRACEGYCETALIDIKDPDTGEVRDRKPLVPLARRSGSVENMAANAALRLIANFRIRLFDTLDEAVQDSFLIAASLLASVEGRRLTRSTNDEWPAITDVQGSIEKAAKRVAENKRAALREELAQLPHLILERGPGAPPKSLGQRQREGKKFLADVDAAYRKLRGRRGTPPTKTDVARELGIGGDPKRGGQSALQVFSAKLKRYNIDYRALVEKIESELNK